MTRYTALVTDIRFPDYSIEQDLLARENVAVEFHNGNGTFADALSRADALLANLAPITRDVIARAPRVKIVARYGIGYDNVDLDACRERGVIVTNVPDYCTNETAEHTIALLLATLRQIPYHDARVRKGEWNIRTNAPVFRVKGSTLGIIGYGRIGKRVHEMVRGFGFERVLVTTRTNGAKAIRDAGGTPVTLETLLCESDIVTVHVPLNEETRGMIGAREFSLMKKNALFLNTARGKVVDEEALYDALIRERIAMAGLDVFGEEPLPKESPFFTLQNVVLTDHQAWYSEESIAVLKRKVCENVIAVLKGEPPLSPVC